MKNIVFLKMTIGIILSIIVFFTSSFFNADYNLAIVLALAILIFSFWLQETFPLPITSLLPLILFPLFNIMDLDKVASFYSHQIVFLMFSGFLLGIILQKWHLDKRIALNILKYSKNHPFLIILCFMITSAF